MSVFCSMTQAGLSTAPVRRGSISNPVKKAHKDVVVEGVLKLEDGARMVQLLDPLELLKIEEAAAHRKENHG